MKLQNAFIVLADINGYTKFVKQHRFNVMHAEQIISELLESVADASQTPLILNEIEGDAANFYALSDNSPEMAQGVIAQVESFFDAFQTSLNKIVCNNLCPCDSCGRAAELKLKAILHHGEVAMRKVQRFEGPAGESMILSHRLLKNSINVNEYILVTDDFFQLCGTLSDSEFTAGVENCEGIGKVRIWYRAQPDSEQADDILRSLVAGLAQLFRMDFYALKKFLGFGHSGKFKSLEGL